MEPIRLQKYLANHGLASRRAVEKMIEAKEIIVAGKVAKLGDKVNGTEKISIKGTPFAVTEVAPTLIAFHKPRGVITTMAHETVDESSPNNKKKAKTLVDFSFGPERLYPVGRLDKESRGLILMTNDGELANKLTHPSHEHEKEYIITVDRKISDGMLKKLESGTIMLDGKEKTPVGKTTCKRVSDHVFTMVLKEGRNRQIRRMCDKVFLTVTDLKRIRIANINLDGLPSGATKKLDPKDLAI